MTPPPVTLEHPGRVRLRRALACVVLCAAGCAVPPVAALEEAGDNAVVQARAVGLAWQPPLRPPVLERQFDAPSAPWDAAHRGVDLLGQVGQEVLAPAHGVVAFSGTIVDRGVLTLLHPSGLRTSLEPLASPLVEGDTVSAGEVVGTVQAVAGHCRPRACVHWGVRDGDDYVDPLSLLGRPRAVLLPLHGPVSDR